MTDAWPARPYPRCEFREVTEEGVRRVPPSPPAALDAIEAALVEAIESTAGHEMTQLDDE